MGELMEHFQITYFNLQITELRNSRQGFRSIPVRGSTSLCLLRIAIKIESDLFFYSDDHESSPYHFLVGTGYRSSVCVCSSFPVVLLSDQDRSRKSNGDFAQKRKFVSLFTRKAYRSYFRCDRISEEVFAYIQLLHCEYSQINLSIFIDKQLRDQTYNNYYYIIIHLKENKCVGTTHQFLCDAVARTLLMFAL